MKSDSTSEIWGESTSIKSETGPSVFSIETGGGARLKENSERRLESMCGEMEAWIMSRRSIVIRRQRSNTTALSVDQETLELA